MAGITLAQAEAQLTTWLTAMEKVASGQEYEIGNRKMTRANLAEIRETIEYWDSKVQQLDRNSGSGGLRVRPVVPV